MLELITMFLSIASLLEISLCTLDFALAHDFN